MRMIFSQLAGERTCSAPKAFVAALGFGFNAQFTNDDAACMVVEENISVMLLTEPFFKGFP